MEAIRTWALTVALAALAGGIVWLLAPKGTVQKAVRTVVAVFMLCAFLSPLVSLRGLDFTWLLPEEAAMPTIPGLDEALSRQLQTAVEEELNRRISAVLEAREIQILPGQILIRTDILPDGGINIATAKVILEKAVTPPGLKTAGLAQALRDAVGFEVEIERKE